MKTGQDGLFANPSQLSPGSGVRTGTTVQEIKQSFLENLFCGLGRLPAVATPNDAYTALALTIRDRLFSQGIKTAQGYNHNGTRIVAYLSAEFLPGPHLANNLLSLGITEQTRQAMSELGLDLQKLIGQEE